MADTTRDVRIRSVERLVADLLAAIDRRRYGSVRQTQRARSLLEEMAGKAALLRYSYMEDADLASYGETLALAEAGVEVAAALRDNVGIDAERRARVDFFAAVLAHLPTAFGLGPSVESLTPVEVGEVLNAERAPKAKNLLRRRVGAFGGAFQIVTNLTKTRPGDRMKVARVPPSDVMGLLSEAQFVGEAGPDATLGERPELSEDEAAEVRRGMGRILDG